jgi:hypothetical protein
MAAAAIRKESMTDIGLQFSRRKNADGSNFYFIANRSGKRTETWVTLQTKSNGVALFNPMTAQSGVAEYKKTDAGFTGVYLQLDSNESCIVQTSSKAITGSPYPYIKSKGTAVEISGEWTLQFTEGGPSLPATTTMNELKAWTDLAGDAFKTFSGTASYSIHFKKPSGNASEYLLDLGKVYESAQVIINGKKMATLIGPVYATTIAGKDLKGDNLLEIKVSNSMANRIIDLDKRKVFWKKFNNTNFPARRRENRGSDGLFDASKWEPRVSGLKGPVTISIIN